MNKQTQALKLALELLDKPWQCTQVWSLEEALDVADNIREALAEQPAQQQEPVAWLHTKIEGVAVPHRPADLDKHPARWTALYPEPKPCPTCEALARTVMMDQTAHDKQRKPLTDEQIMEMYNEPRSDAEMIAFARAIEAAHGVGEQK